MTIAEGLILILLTINLVATGAAAAVLYKFYVLIMEETASQKKTVANAPLPVNMDELLARLANEPVSSTQTPPDDSPEGTAWNLGPDVKLPEGNAFTPDDTRG